MYGRLPMAAFAVPACVCKAVPRTLSVAVILMMTPPLF